MRSHLKIVSIALAVIVLSATSTASLGAEAISAPGSKPAPASENRIITESDVTAERVGDSIPVEAIGEPVSAVTVSAPRWVAGANAASSYATVDGSILPVDPNGKPINFRVILPASWSRRAIQQGGGGMNGMITVGGGG